MEIQRQIEIVKQLLEATIELDGEFQAGWHAEIKAGKDLLTYLNSKLENTTTDEEIVYWAKSLENWLTTQNFY